MIKANELRIGNAALLNGKTVYIQQISSNLITYSSIELQVRSEYCDIPELSPIPLTPGVLEKCGFERNEDGYWWKIWGEIGVKFILWDSYYNGFKFKLEGRVYELIKHLHQLQNLYFALTGEELEYKP